MSSNVRLTDESTSGGFLSGFVESSVEMPADGKNGQCVVHYEGEHSNCELNVRLSNGMKEGMATIMKDGAPFIQIEYHRGSANGSVCRMDDYGVVVLRGQLMNGVEHGLFLEYGRNDKVVWRGYYRNGVRYSEVVESRWLVGYHDEKNVATGSLLSVAEYDKDLKDKNGRCFAYENGRVKSECVYENGVKKRTIREFVDGKMIVFDSAGKKVYEGRWFGDMKSGFLCHEPMEGMVGFFKEVDSTGQLIAVSQYDELNVYENGKCFNMENGKVKRVCLYSNGEMKRVMMEFNGSTMTEYNESGKRVYEGGFSGDMKSGFVRKGRGYELDESERVKRVCIHENGVMKRVIQEFSGDWITEYDDNGKKVYEGEFKGDTKNGFMRNGYGYCLNVNGNNNQYCLYDNGQLILVIQKLTGSSMTEYDENGKRRYVGEFNGDMKNGFKRNGKGYCLDENQVVKQYCMFENGVMKRVIQSFAGTTMTEYQENGVMSYLGEWKGDMTNGFVREGKGKEYDQDGKKAIYSGEWKSGKREGFGTEYRDGHAWYTGEWRNGLRNGEGKEMNEKGKVVFAGEWSDGKGKGKEMDESGNVVYEGEWSDGMRNGKGEEMNGMRAVGHWKNGKKDGMVYERDGNRVIKRGCLYENGELKQVVQEFNDATMIQFDKDGRKVYEGGFKGDVENGFMRNGLGKEYRMVEEKVKSTSEPRIEIEKKRFCCWVKEIKHEVPGVELASKRYREEVIAGYWKNEMVYELDGNGKPKQLYLYKNGKKSQVLARFNGSTMTEFDRNGKRVYEGECKGSTSNGYVREGKGREYKSGGETVVYSGEWKNGKRDGEGKEMDENGKVVKSGRWENGVYQRVKSGTIPKEMKTVVPKEMKTVVPKEMKTVVIPFSLTSNPQTIKELRIGNNSYNDSSVTELKLSGLARLKRIVIGDKCFGSVRLVELDGLGELESVVTGKESFRISEKQRTDGACRIVNSPKLKSITVGHDAFDDYYSLELFNLPSLQSIDMGNSSFYQIQSFSLTDLPQLQSIRFGDHVLYYCQSVLFENLPKLQSIQLGLYAFFGDSRDDRKTISYNPFNYKNTLTMRNLPSLTEFKGDRFNFMYIGSVILENIPKLQSSGIQFDGDNCFSYTYSLQSSSTLSLVSSSFDATALESAIRRKNKYI